MAQNPHSVGFQPRTSPAERRADLDLRRLIAEHRGELDGLRTDVDGLDVEMDAVETRVLRLETAKCQVSRVATQSVAHGVTTDVSFDTEQYDPQDWWDSGTPAVVTPNIVGLYQVTFIVEWGTDGDYSRRLANARRNGATITSPLHRSELANDFVFPTPHGLVTPLILMNGTTDYFNVAVYQENTSGGSNTVVVALLVELKVPL